MTKLTASELEHLSEAELQSLLIPDLLPRHIAVIMDGNGRWAAQRGMPGWLDIPKGSNPSGS